MGSATAWQLSKAGENVLLLEQQDEDYTYGSSYGEARICRSLGPKNDIWSYLHRRAVDETKQLVDFLNIHDQANHSMEDIYTDSPVTYILYTNKGEAAQRLLRQQEDTHECAVNPEEAADKFGVKVPKDRIVIQEYKKYTGTMNPQQLIKKLQKGIQLKGGLVHFSKKVQKATRKGGFYEVETIDTKTGHPETIQAKRIVSAVGPYSGQVLEYLAPNISSLITPKRVFLAFLKIDESRFESYSGEQKQKMFNFHPLIDLGPDHIFSMVEKRDERGHPLIKVGGHFLRNEISDLDEVWTKELTKDEIDWAKKSTLDYFEFLNIPLNYKQLRFQQGYSCVYSLTETEVPIVSNLPSADKSPDQNAVMLGGMSGVGAKGSLTYGLLATDLLLGREEKEFMYKKVKKALSLIH